MTIASEAKAKASTFNAWTFEAKASIFKANAKAWTFEVKANP